MEITAVYVPLDGSERAERALGPATALAERSDAKLILLATLWPNERLDTVEHHLDACAAFADHPASPMLVVDRSPAEAICDAAAQPGALVCMTTRGRGAVRAALLGSEGEAALRASARPIVFVGPAFDPKWVLRAQPLVIAGVDGSGRSFAAARDAGEFAATLHGRVCVLEALRPSDIATARAYLAGDVEKLGRVVRDLRRSGRRADSEVVHAFDAAAELAAAAEEQHAAFISVASHGRTGIARGALGSVAIGTVRSAPCPVLVSGPGVQWPAIEHEN